MESTEGGGIRWSSGEFLRSGSQSSVIFSMVRHNALRSSPIRGRCPRTLARADRETNRAGDPESIFKTACLTHSPPVQTGARYSSPTRARHHRHCLDFWGPTLAAIHSPSTLSRSYHFDRSSSKLREMSPSRAPLFQMPRSDSSLVRRAYLGMPCCNLRNRNSNWCQTMFLQGSLRCAFDLFRSTRIPS
jgi:hypothetical protein